MPATKYKVAIIEDDTAISDMYKFRLLDSGYNVQTATDGKLGLKLIADFQPDVVLLDLMMPIMNGLEVLQTLKQNPDYTKAKIIVLSNMGDSETVAKIASFKVDDHIVKVELTPAEIEQRIRALLTT